MERNILIVDSHPEFAQNLAEELSERNPDCDIEVCYSGPHALHRCNVKQFDLVITEMGLQGLDGLKLVWLLKRELEHDNFILMTDNNWELAQVRANPLYNNLAQHIVKPIDVDEIYMLIEAATSV